MDYRFYLEWDPTDILLMTRPVPIDSTPREVKQTGKASFEWAVEGGCPEVSFQLMLNVCIITFTIQ